MEAVSSSWLQADMKCVGWWWGGGMGQFHAVFLYVISEALIISLEQRCRKLVLLLLLFLFFVITSILKKKQTGTKAQQGTRQRNKAADLIGLL